MSSPTLPTPSTPVRHLALRAVRRLAVATTAGGILLATAPVDLGNRPVAEQPAATTELSPVAATSSRGRPWPGHPDRRLVGYTVKPGDTATGLAVRFHAWTAELLALNGRAAGGSFYVGERIRIPVVVSAARKDRGSAKPSTTSRATRRPAGPWRGAGASRPAVRRLIVQTARRHGVQPNLALAVAWQESGWQQRRVSSAHALGVMQVLPSTARWMSLYAGRRLDPHHLRDNVTAGVLLLKVLRGQATYKRTIAAYYQGLAGVRAHGMYDDTRAYVANVRAIRQQLSGGWNPV